MQARLCPEAALRPQGLCSAERYRQTGKGAGGAQQHFIYVCRSVTHRSLKTSKIKIELEVSDGKSEEMMRSLLVLSAAPFLLHAFMPVHCPYWPLLAGICLSHFIDLSLQVNTCLCLSVLAFYSVRPYVDLYCSPEYTCPHLPSSAFTCTYLP